MFTKFAKAEVVRVFKPEERTASTKLSGFDYEPRTDGKYLYAAVRACTADVPNLNYDMLPDRELKTAYQSFIGAYNYLNHDNQDPAKARGAVIDARYHDEDPDDKWVECLIEMDEDRCPKLCSLIRSGEIDTVSMGCNVESTTCSVCGKTAEYPFQYCEHIQQKGRTFGGKLAYEICNGIDFFELSWVYDPADPTAHTERVASKSASGVHWDYEVADYLEPVGMWVVDSPIGPSHAPHMEGGIDIMLTMDGVDMCRFSIDGSEFDSYVESGREWEIRGSVDEMASNLVDELNEYQVDDFESVDAAIDYHMCPVEDVRWLGRTASVRTAAPSNGFGKFMNKLFRSLNSVKTQGVDKWKKSVEKDVQHSKRLNEELGKYKLHDDGYYYYDKGGIRYMVSQDPDSGKWQFAEMQKNRKGGYDPKTMSTVLFDSYEDAVSAYISSKSKGSDAASMFMGGDELKEALGAESYGTSDGADSADADSASQSDGDGSADGDGDGPQELLEGHHYCGYKDDDMEHECWVQVSDELGADEPCPRHGGEKLSRRFGSGSYATAPRIPDDVDIDGETAEACPLCGDPNYDGEFCDVCGYEEPPEGFGDIQIEDVSDYDDYEQDADDESADYDFGDDGYDYASEQKADQLAESGQEASDEFGDSADAEDEGEVDMGDRKKGKTAMYADTFEYGFIERNGDFRAGMVHIDNEDEYGVWICEVYGINGDDFDGFGSGDTYQDAIEGALADAGLDLDDGEYWDLVGQAEFLAKERGEVMASRKVAGGLEVELFPFKLNGETAYEGSLCGGEYWFEIYRDPYGWECRVVREAPRDDEWVFGSGDTEDEALIDAVRCMRDMGIEVTASVKTSAPRPGDLAYKVLTDDGYLIARFDYDDSGFVWFIEDEDGRFYDYEDGFANIYDARDDLLSKFPGGYKVYASRRTASTYELARKLFKSLIRMDYPYTEYAVQVDGTTDHMLDAANDEEAIAMFLNECPNATVHDKPIDISNKWASRRTSAVIDWREVPGGYGLYEWDDGEYVFTMQKPDTMYGDSSYILDANAIYGDAVIVDGMEFDSQDELEEFIGDMSFTSSRRTSAKTEDYFEVSLSSDVCDGWAYLEDADGVGFYDIDIEVDCYGAGGDDYIECHIFNIDGNSRDIALEIIQAAEFEYGDDLDLDEYDIAGQIEAHLNGGLVASRRKRADFWNPSEMEQKLMDMDNDIWDAHGWNSGNQVRDNWDAYRGDVAKELPRRGIGHGDITVDVLDGLTDNNFHSLRRVLEEMGIFAASRRYLPRTRRGSRRKVAMPWHRNAPSFDDGSEWYVFDTEYGAGKVYAWDCGQGRCIVIYSDDFLDWRWVELKFSYSFFEAEMRRNNNDENMVITDEYIGRTEVGFRSAEEAYEAFADWWDDNRHTAILHKDSIKRDFGITASRSRRKTSGKTVWYDKETGEIFETKEDAMRDAAEQFDFGDETNYLTYLGFPNDELPYIEVDEDILRDLLDKFGSAGRRVPRRKTASDGWAIFIGAVLAPALGEWVSLPCDDSVIDNAIEKACAEYEKYNGEPCEETMIPDYEGEFGMSARDMEYADPYEINAAIGELSSAYLPDEVIEGLISNYGLYNAARYVDDVFYIEADTEEDLAYNYIEETGGVDALGRDTLERYFDYAAFGRDLAYDFMQYDGYFIHTAKVGGKYRAWGLRRSASRKSALWDGFGDGEYMTRDDILSTIRQLSMSQGFYGRMLDSLEDMREYDYDAYNDLMAEWESKKFRDPVDFIMYVEG